MRIIEKTYLITGIFIGLVSCDQKATTESETEATEVVDKDQKAKNPDVGEAPKGMVWIPGGKYTRGNGSADPEMRARFSEEFPAHEVEVDGFWMDETEVTNAQFAEFVKATGYKTQAEKGLSQKDFPKAKPEDLVGGANVFVKPKKDTNPYSLESRRAGGWRWWSFTKGASWRHPDGPETDIKDRMDHPVRCVTIDDAKAYAKWAGKRLPTEAEWEKAARGGEDQLMYIWGNEMLLDNKWQANVYQGKFPSDPKELDGYLFAAPVKSFAPNKYGLYDMAGNVWEICSDYYHPGYYSTFQKEPHKNPKGPAVAITDQELQGYSPYSGTCPVASPDAHPLTHMYVTKGGSFLCHYTYCLRFRPAARHYCEPLTPSHHTGFRCVKDKK